MRRQVLGLLLPEVVYGVDLGVVGAEFEARLDAAQHDVVDHLAGVAAVQDVAARLLVQQLDHLLVPEVIMRVKRVLVVNVGFKVFDMANECVGSSRNDFYLIKNRKTRILVENT